MKRIGRYLNGAIFALLAHLIMIVPMQLTTYTDTGDYDFLIALFCAVLCFCLYFVVRWVSGGNRWLFGGITWLSMALFSLLLLLCMILAGFSFWQCLAYVLYFAISEVVITVAVLGDFVFAAVKGLCKRRKKPSAVEETVPPPEDDAKEQVASSVTPVEVPPASQGNAPRKFLPAILSWATLVVLLIVTPVAHAVVDLDGYPDDMTVEWCYAHYDRLYHPGSSYSTYSTDPNFVVLDDALYVARMGKLTVEGSTAYYYGIQGVPLDLAVAASEYLLFGGNFEVLQRKDNPTPLLFALEASSITICREEWDPHVLDDLQEQYLAEAWATWEGTRVGMLKVRFADTAIWYEADVYRNGEAYAMEFFLRTEDGSYRKKHLLLPSDVCAHLLQKGIGDS